jgi:L-fucose isomerase-like protein
MLNASYNFALRKLKVHIPENPVGLPDELAGEIAHFQDVAKVIIGLGNLKIFSFGPRPQDFYACNAPIHGLYSLGVEVMENSELDLLGLFNKIDEKDPAVKRIIKDMQTELGEGNSYPDLLPKLARFELALRRFAEENLGSRQYAAFANKCWPAFESAFGFVPCYVNSRLAASGIPAACEVDLYGAMSEYLCQLATDSPATLLDINNTVPNDMITKKSDLKGAAARDLFMGFHCGNTPSCCMKNCSLKYQLIMKRLMEDPKCPPNITRGTLEGQLKPGEVTLFRLQGRAQGGLESYIAQGNTLDIDPQSFGSIGIIAVPNFARFYRHVLVEKHFPHHAAVAFGSCGKILFDALKLLGLENIHTPLPASVLYKTENPF